MTTHTLTLTDWRAAVAAYVAALPLEITRHEKPGTDVLSPNARVRNGYRATPAPLVSWRITAPEAPATLVDFMADEFGAYRTCLAAQRDFDNVRAHLVREISDSGWYWQLRDDADPLGAAIVAALPGPAEARG